MREFKRGVREDLRQIESYLSPCFKFGEGLSGQDHQNQYRTALFEQLNFTYFALLLIFRT